MLIPVLSPTGCCIIIRARKVYVREHIKELLMQLVGATFLGKAIAGAYSCVESDRLLYHRSNREGLRSETCQGFAVAVGEGNFSEKKLGVKCILHSSFTGGRRYMVLDYQDGMAYVDGLFIRICFVLLHVIRDGKRYLIACSRFNLFLLLLLPSSLCSFVLCFVNIYMIRVMHAFMWLSSKKYGSPLSTCLSG